MMKRIILTVSVFLLSISGFCHEALMVMDGNSIPFAMAAETHLTQESASFDCCDVDHLMNVDVASLSGNSRQVQYKNLHALHSHFKDTENSSIEDPLRPSFHCTGSHNHRSSLTGTVIKKE